MKVLTNLVLALILLVFVQQAQAAWELPTSTHHQGSANYNFSPSGGGTLSGHIDYAVYDTIAYPAEFTGTVSGSGQYIYAYQIFNDDLSSDRAIEYFAIFGFGEPSLDVDAGSITAQADPAPTGITPSSQSFTVSNTRAVWNFAGGSLIKDKHSWLLLFRSSQDWVVGTYELRTPENDNELPIPPEIPEPATFAILSVGGMIIAGRRKRK